MISVSPFVRRPMLLKSALISLLHALEVAHNPNRFRKTKKSVCTTATISFTGTKNWSWGSFVSLY